MDLSSIAAAIVAGGLARRFDGQDKSRLIVEGRTIITRQVAILQQVAGTIVIVANDAGRFADLGLPVYADRVPGAGAIGGIDAALHATAADRVIVVACDLPFLHAGVLARLVERAGQGDGAWVRTPRGVEPLLACYRQRARARVRAEIEAGRLKAGALGSVLSMAELGLDELAEFGAPERLLANINTPGDYARVQ
jgi:molybdopterin-guanine dinucleotide biosynthesis protein A